MPELKDVVNVVLEDQQISGRYVIERCEQLAQSRKHEDATDGLDAVQSSVSESKEVRTNRRRFFEIAVGFFIIRAADSISNFTIGQIGDWASAAANKVAGKEHEIRSEFVAELERARKSGGTVPATIFTADEQRFHDVMFRVHRSETLPEDLRALREISSGRNAGTVRVYAAQLLSTELGRWGQTQEAIAILQEDVDADTIPKELAFANLVQRANVRFASIPRGQYSNPSAWDVQADLAILRDQFSNEMNIPVVTESDRIQIGLALHNYGAPLIHARAFNWQTLSARQQLSETERREIWDEQLRFFKICFDATVVGDSNYSRAIWNHYYMTALQAHRFGDFEYRNRVIGLLLDDEKSPIKDLSAHLGHRFSQLDHLYVMLLLFLNTIPQDDKKFEVHPKHEAQLDYAIAHRGKLRSQVIRTALDTFRKKRAGEFDEEAAIRDYLVSQEQFCGMVLKILP